MQFPAEPWCLTIPRLEHRRQEFARNWGSQVSFHSGFDYLDCDIEELLAIHDKRRLCRNDNPAWLAMYFGHLTLWKQLLDRPGDRWLIFEDDVAPTGEPFRILHVELVRYFRPPKDYPLWCSSACYCLSRGLLERLVECPVAASPDRILKAVEHFDPTFADPSPVKLVASGPSYEV